MKARFILACAAVGVAASAFTATTASAEEQFTGTIGFSPAVVSPGQAVDIFGTCNDPKFTTTPVISLVLDAPDLRGRDNGAGVKRLISHATVKQNVGVGDHQINFKCGTTIVSGHLKVIEKRVEPYAAIGIQDREIRPGQEVLVVASCNDPKFVSSEVASPVLGFLTQGPPLVKKGEDTTMFAEAVVDKNAKPGDYPISFTCFGKQVVGEFTVLGAAPPAAAKATVPVKANAAQVPVKPKGAAETGELAGQPVDIASNPTGLLLGGAGALLAAAGAGLWLYRRRQRS